MGFKQETGITDNDRDPFESIRPRSRRVKMDLCDAALWDPSNPSLGACGANLIIALTPSYCSDWGLPLTAGISLSCNVRCPAGQEHIKGGGGGGGQAVKKLTKTRVSGSLLCSLCLNLNVYLDTQVVKELFSHRSSIAEERNFFAWLISKRSTFFLISHIMIYLLITCLFKSFIYHLQGWRWQVIMYDITVSSSFENKHSL